MSLKQDWKEVGQDFKKTGIDLGKSLLRSIRVGVDNATEWADKKEAEKASAVQEKETIIDVPESEIH